MYLNSIVMFSIKFFGFKVRFIVPMDGQRGFSVSRHIKNSCILKTGQCAQYGVGGGGFAEEKKDFGKPP